MDKCKLQLQGNSLMIALFVTPSIFRQDFENRRSRHSFNSFGRSIYQKSLERDLIRACSIQTSPKIKSLSIESLIGEIKSVVFQDEFEYRDNSKVRAVFTLLVDKDVTSEATDNFYDILELDTLLRLSVNSKNPLP